MGKSGVPWQMGFERPEHVHFFPEKTLASHPGRKNKGAARMGHMNLSSNRKGALYLGDQFDLNQHIARQL
jgi:hypothetical protein